MVLTEEQRKTCRSKIEPWRDVMTRDPVDEAPEVIFSIPLISKEKANNWSKVCSNLTKTVESLRRQTSPNWKAVICCQSKPDGIEFDDKVTFLPFTRMLERTDKAPKRKAIFEFCRDSFSGDKYLFYLDADDLAHPTLVEYILDTRDPSGYLVDRGFLYDTVAGKLAPLYRPTPDVLQKQKKKIRWTRQLIRLRNIGRRLTGREAIEYPARLARMRSFDSKCGSCVAWRYRCGGNRENSPDVPEFSHSFVRPASEEGLVNLHKISFEAMIYVVGHGENLEELVGGVQRKLEYADEFGLPEREAKKVLHTFGLL
ncbi:glycosyltransferase family A protein [Ruegeria sp. SCP11]|uniref:glycosyltransferase family A protein n=1 Tax=Ruegeria sp. SCP11 TaxID=3141378 RepID=UPI00333D3599